MKDIILSTPKFDSLLDKSALENIAKLIVREYQSIEVALLKTGIDSRYYQHWIMEAKRGDDRARKVITFLHSLLEERKANITKRVANGEDMKALVSLLQILEDRETPIIDATDNSTLYIADNWELE